MKKRHFLKRIISFLLCFLLVCTLNGKAPLFGVNAKYALGASGEGPSLGQSEWKKKPSMGQSGSTDADDDNTSFAGWRVIDESTVEVSTYDGLVDALADVKYTHIYFANDITPEAPVRQSSIHSGKAEQYIYGRAYGGSEIFTFTQPDSSDPLYAIRVMDGSACTYVEVSDMKISGRNFYGVVSVPESQKGVITRYDNVTYTGPQPGYNRGGTAQFADVTITLSYGHGNTTGEVAEAYNIEFEGSNSIDTDLESNGNALFLMTRINGDSGTFQVHPDAEVQITGPNYLLYSDGAADQSPKIIFGENSSFYAGCGQGFFAQYVNEVDIAPGASVRLVQSDTTADGYALKIRNKLTVQQGAVFELLRPKGGTAAIQMFNNNSVVTFDHPERVVLYANSNLLLAGVGGSAIHINTDAVNLWTTAPGGSSAGIPAQIWNKYGQNQTLSVNATWSATNVMGNITSNLDRETDPVTSDINADTFAIRNSQLLVLGRFKLEIDEVAAGNSVVTGKTEPNATLTGTYTTAAGTAGAVGGGMADEGGRYELPLEEGQPLPGSRVYVTAYSNNLRMRQYPYEIEEEPGLKFLSVPDIRFETVQVPAVSTYVKRADPDWAITVRDTYKDSSGFRVEASIRQPMSGSLGEDTYTIPNSLVYVDSEGIRTPLSDRAVTVFSDDSGAAGNHTMSWDDTQGLLMWVGPGDDLHADVQYSTTIYWTLVSGP